LSRSADDGSRGAAVLFGSAGLLAGGNLASRLVGFVRDRVLATTYGAGTELSAFLIASKVPMHLYNLLVGGQLSAALVPVLAAYATKERGELRLAASAVLSAVAIAMSAAALLVLLFADQLAGWLSAGLGVDGVRQTAGALRIMAPAGLIFGLGGALTALLLSVERFRYPAAAGAVYNIGMIAMVVGLSPRLGAAAMPLGVLAGALGQLALLAYGANRAGVGARLTMRLRHPALQRIGLLYAPIAGGLLVTDVFLPALDGRWSSLAGSSARALLDLATRLTQFPHGFISVAISLALLPALAAAHARAEPELFSRMLSRGIRMVVALSVPAAIGLAVLAEPVAGAAFQAGRFGDADRIGVALALAVYLVGLPFASFDWPLNYAFYARGNTWLPALIGVGSVLVWAAVAWTLTVRNVFSFPASRVYLGLALADSAKHAAHACVMLYLTRRVMGPRSTEGLLATAAAAVAAALTMAGAVWWVDGLLAVRVPASALGWALRATIGVALGIAIYVPLAARLGVDEVGWFLRTARARLGSGRHANE